MSKPPLWLLIADITDPAVPLVVPSVAWMAQDAGVAFECYLEAERDGTLFARTGSTVLGGFHHQQFNYLCATFEVKVILFGKTALFDSSLETFHIPVLASTDTPEVLYRTLLAQPGVTPAQAVLLASNGLVEVGEGALELAPYLFPEIFYRKALAFAAAHAEGASSLAGESAVHTLYLSAAERAQVAVALPHAQEIDTLHPDDDYGSLTLRVAERWKGSAKGVMFGDPAAVLAQLPSHCRHRRIAVYAPRTPLPPQAVVTSAYTEETSAIAEAVSRLAEEVGNRVITGRQTCDGDLFAWSKRGVCMQIIDPNRPVFPVVETVPHRWTEPDADLYAQEPDDDTLRRYAREGKLLATLLWHSGEVAHNEAMLNLFDLACWTGLKMGIGVHAARYETAPQLWELLNVARAKGGVRGLVEPVLHSGGMGVMAEFNCPAELLRAHCDEALSRIRRIAGDAGTPRGYYAFMDSDLATLTQQRPDLYRAIEASGLEYVVSSVSPGRNRVIHQSKGCVVLNQSCRVIHSASPFVRVTTAEDLTTAPRVRPGWLVATLDAPVISFGPYIWRHGSRFMGIVDALTHPNIVNVLPHTVARYARLLEDA